MVTIAFAIPPELSRVPRVRAAMQNAGEFIRDLWLARSPYATGDYAQGLMHTGAIRLRGNKLEITNRSKHADVVEHGFRSYNIGMAMLNKSRGVQISAEGYRYKVIKIDQGPSSRYRKPSVAQQVQKSFAKLQPLGVRSNPVTRFGGERYKPKARLRKPLKGGPLRPGRSGVVVISEKAIKEDPQKWQMPAREGRRLAEKVQKEGAKIVKEVIRKIVVAEKERQTRMNKKPPTWYKPSFARSPMRRLPVSGGRK